jgi:hypothetical protein
MAYDLTVMFKTDENGSWEERPIQYAELIRGDFREDPTSPDTEYFHCYVERKNTVYAGYMDKDRIMRITKVYAPNKFQMEELLKSKKIKIAEVEKCNESFKDFLNGKGGIEDLVDDKTKTEAKEKSEDGK